MSFRYLILAAMFVVGFVILKNWSEFSDQQRLQDQLANNTSQAAMQIDNSGDIPTVSQNKNTLPENIASANNEGVVSVETDVLTVKISPQGDLVFVSLKNHKQNLKALEGAGDNQFVILEQGKKRNYIMQSGLVGKNGTDTQDARATYKTELTNYELQPGQDKLEVNLVHTQKNGAVITKQYVFRPNDYLIDVNYIVDNKSSQPWQGVFYGQIKRDGSEDPSMGMGGLGLQPFLGIATTTDETRFEKFDFGDIDKSIEKGKPFTQKKSDAWIAMIQHYFLSAWIAPKGVDYDYAALKTSNGEYLARLTSPSVQVNPKETNTFNSQFYVGPKDQYRLEKVAKGIDLSVDYSFLWWVAQPLYRLLNFFATGRIHMFGIDKQVFPGVGNWGIAIILLTLLVKALFFKLNQKAYGSMARMKKFAPKMQSIKEQYPDDRQKQSQAMMALYKKEKINPMGGCLPMLVQMPVFLALYWVLMESVELRHAPFFGWIQDLSARDPWFILPIIMGASMWFQQKLNPTPADPMQAKVMQWLPVIFSVFFLFFPAGLVLYWVVNNILSIAQQWYITRQIEREEKRAAPA